MFTGIIEHVGTVLAVRASPAGRRLRIDLGPLATSAAHGASIAVDGACLTVAESGDSWAEFDVVPETLRRTTIGALRVNDRVNLERAMTASSRFDGHIVQGHVDTLATLVRVDKSGGEWRLGFELDETEYAVYLVPKGSVAVSGVSLTIAELHEATFGVALVPTTLARTSLAALAIGQKVNIETDMLARIVINYLRRTADPGAAAGGGLTFEQLREAGWM